MIGDLLTLEQLRGMERPTPVWAEIQNKTVEGWDGYWCLCIRGYILTPGLISMYAEKMEGVKFYTYSPVHIDREAWRCPICSGNEVIEFKAWKTPEQIINGPFAQGGAMFCPRCGKPRTPEAWAELEKRLRG